MKTQNRRSLLAILPAAVLSGFLLASVAHAQLTEPPGVPLAITSSQTPFQQQTHFLVFPGKVAGENATTATAYYNAIDPGQNNRDFPHWLLNAGFINDIGQWHATGTQQVACNLPGCDWPQGTYGDNIINTDSHAIVLNAADLGFVRNQFIRCVPSCSASNPIIYTYLENYPVAPFANHGSNFTNFAPSSGETSSSYPTQAEAAGAINSAITRPPGSLPATSCDLTKTQNAFACKISRIADVAFAWAPPPGNPASSSRYGQIYAFLFDDTDTSNIKETVYSPTAGMSPNMALGVLETFNANDPFAPNLDFIGNKQNPGVCLICHGGTPSKLTSTFTYPNQGSISGFRFLPLDVRNLIFTSDSGTEQPGLPVSQMYTSRLGQEPQMKAYNLAVLKTVPTQAESDGQVRRVAHLREVITGWYTDPGSPVQFNRTIQNGDFVPVGWREPANGGTAPAGSEWLYKSAFSTSCRSCHFNRELSLDFGTVANFKAESDLLQYALLPACSPTRPSANGKYMPLAHLTYDKYWEANSHLITLPSGQPPLTLSVAPGSLVPGTAEQIANFFGFNGTAGYCGTHP